MIIWGKKVGRRPQNLWYEVPVYTQHSWPWLLPPTSASVEKPTARCVSFTKGKSQSALLRRAGRPHPPTAPGVSQPEHYSSPQFTIIPHLGSCTRGPSTLGEESQSLPHPVWDTQGGRAPMLSVYNDLILSDLKFGCLMQSSKQVTSTVTKKEGTILQP